MNDGTPTIAEAERRVIGVANEWYDLAHSTNNDVDAWREITRKMDLAVQALRKAVARLKDM